MIYQLVMLAHSYSNLALEDAINRSHPSLRISGYHRLLLVYRVS